MKIYFLFSIFALSVVSSNAQDIKIHYQNQGSDVLIYADNPHPCPVSIKLDLTLTNLSADIATRGSVKLIPESTSDFLLATLTTQDPSKNGSYHTQYKCKYGDVNLGSYNSNYIYELPYERGRKVMVHQGYNGRFSHTGVNAIDFNLKKGNKLYAARGGIVIHTEDRNSRGCTSPKCHKYNNTIVIYHGDGTIAVYSHLKRNGAKVHEGDKVEKGQFIGLSGATGYASGPHLHFMVLVSRFGDNETIKTQFNTLHNGEIYLTEKESYTRPY